MKIELSKVKVCKFASQETTCFEATLLIDGKPAAKVGNDGHGGSNHYYFEDRKLEHEFVAFCKAQPALKTEFGELSMDADLYIGVLLEDWNETRKLKSWCKKSTVFRLPTDGKGIYRKVNIPFDPALKARLLVKYPEAEFINERVA